MNSFGNYIFGLKKSNTTLFKANKISLTPESFEKELERAYNQGYKDSESAYDKKSLWDKVFGFSVTDATTSYVCSKIESESKKK